MDDEEELMMRDDEVAAEGDDAEEHCEDGIGDEQQQQQNAECKLMAPALISIHPGGASAVVCIGAGLRVFDLEKNAPIAPSDSTDPGAHRAAIRAARFDSSGKYFVSAGDDKLVKLWDAESWKCLKTVVAHKKPSAVAFTRDSKWLFAADKFGVVYVLPFLQEGLANASEEPVQLLAHCCSIITSLECSPCGKYVVTADRDCKIRVSVLPRRPLAGAHEIQSFCLGHTSFVSCLAFVASSQSMLVSGGGDATIRLWDCGSGELLDTVQISTIVDESGDSSPVVIALTVSSTVVAASVESFPGILLFDCDAASKKLSFFQKVVLQDGICSTGLQFDLKNRLWLVAGAGETREVGDRAVTPEQLEQLTTEAQSSAKSSLAWLRILDKAEGSTFQVGETPGGLALLKALQGHEAEPYVPNATQAAELALKKLMSKRQYSDEGRERRKRNRNDKKSQAAVNTDGTQETRPLKA